MMGRLWMLRWFRGELRTEKSPASSEPWKTRFIVLRAVSWFISDLHRIGMLVHEMATR
jgi:hypothetical protein